jgi:integrase
LGAAAAGREGGGSGASSHISGAEMLPLASCLGGWVVIRVTSAPCGLPLVHSHQLRHAAGFALADKGRDLREIQLHLGHKAISNTTQYVELRPGRLDRIWD